MAVTVLVPERAAVGVVGDLVAAPVAPGVAVAGAVEGGAVVDDVAIGIDDLGPAAAAGPGGLFREV